MFSFIGYTSCDLTVVHPTDNARTNKISHDILFISISSLNREMMNLGPPCSKRNLVEFSFSILR